jgi:hypothetical protein
MQTSLYPYHFLFREKIFLAWHPDPKGMFSVKSAYALGIKIRDHQNNSNASSSGSEGSGFDWGGEYGGLTFRIKLKCLCGAWLIMLCR